MAMSLFAPLWLALCLYGTVLSQSIRIDAGASPTVALHPFWKSTGLCPAEPRNETSKFLLSKDEKVNLALIGSLPNQGISQVRIHWLLDLITVRSFDADSSPNYDFSNLDELLDVLDRHGLAPGFELMGNPSAMFDDLGNDTQLGQWRQLVAAVTSRCVGRYGINSVSRWNFETWNEPDLRTYNILNFTLPSYLRYVTACRDGLTDAAMDHRLQLIGPAGLFKSPSRHPLCWGLLDHCSTNVNRCPLDAISYHRKGGGSGTAILDQSLKLVREIHARFPSLAALPLVNDEADPLSGWSKNESWRADVTYAAMVGHVILAHQRRFVTRNKWRLKLLSNDNAFLNYHPHYFTQRTLLARFQMNETTPPHTQFFRKPVYMAMALLSYLGNEQINVKIRRQDSRLSVLASRYAGETAIFVTYSNDTQDDPQLFANVTFKVRNIPPGSDPRVTVFSLDNARTNPNRVWETGGSPVYPDQELRSRMRRAEGPERLMDADPVQGRLTLQLTLRLPSVHLVHICSRPLEPPGQVTALSATNLTWGEVLLTWRIDPQLSRCLATYTVEFSPEPDVPFRRVNVEDVIFLSYQYVVAVRPGDLDPVRGFFRISAVDYWKRKGPYSDILVYL